MTYASQGRVIPTLRTSAKTGWCSCCCALIAIKLCRVMRGKVVSALRVPCTVVLSSGMATLLSLIFQSQELKFRAKLPFLFLILIVVVAKKRGEAAALLSTIAAAMIFALFLFHPLSSFSVATKTARSSLAWFLLGGMVCAHMLSPPKRTKRSSDFSPRDSD